MFSMIRLSTLVQAIKDTTQSASTLKKCHPILGLFLTDFQTEIPKRNAHTDFQVPDFSNVRLKKTMDPHTSNKKSADDRRGFAYAVSSGTLMLTSYAAFQTVKTLVLTLQPAKDVLALATIEVDISKIPEGKSMTYKWRGKPVFVKHRTEADIATAEAVDVSSLRHPETDAERVKDRKFLVVIGVCTHLGCVPIADAGDYGGYYCPCHGSHYDGSGRVRQGPAPLNLEIPEYSFPKPGILIVGE